MSEARPKGGPPILMYFVYILISLKDKRTYVGQTNDFKVRLKLHNEGRVMATKYRRPLVELLTESFSTRAEAMAREKWWKSGAGRRELKTVFKNYHENFHLTFKQ